MKSHPNVGLGTAVRSVCAKRLCLARGAASVPPSRQGVRDGSHRSNSSGRVNAVFPPLSISSLHFNLPGWEFTLTCCSSAGTVTPGPQRGSRCAGETWPKPCLGACWQPGSVGNRLALVFVCPYKHDWKQCHCDHT